MENFCKQEPKKPRSDEKRNRKYHRTFSTRNLFIKLRIKKPESHARTMDSRCKTALLINNQIDSIIKTTSRPPQESTSAAYPVSLYPHEEAGGRGLDAFNGKQIE